MPTLSLPFWHIPALYRINFFEIESVMLFPNDADTRRQYVLNEAIKWFKAESDIGTRTLLRDEVLLPTNGNEAMDSLLVHENEAVRLDQSIARAYDIGCVAGQIAAILMLGQEYYAIEGEGDIVRFEVSIRKAENAIVSAYRGQRLTRNQDYVHKAWRSHKSVAHMWARLVLASSQQTLAEDNPETAFNFFLRPHIAEFIALAEEILHFLCERNNTIEDPWRAPAHAELPSPEELIRDTLPLSADLANALRHYTYDRYRR